MEGGRKREDIGRRRSRMSTSPQYCVALQEASLVGNGWTRRVYCDKRDVHGLLRYMMHKDVVMQISMDVAIT